MSAFRSADLLTPGRLRNYPRVILIVIWSALFLNWAGSTGWLGRGRQILFIDFIVFYSAGVMLRDAPASLYDLASQLALQQSLLAPTPLPGTGPFSHPPYVAPIFEPLSSLSLPMALVVWTAFSILALAAAIGIIRTIFRVELSQLGISTGALAIITLSFAPIVAGLSSGQMHTFVLLGAVAVVALTFKGNQYAAGAIVGLLAVKPQLALGLGLFFLIRGDFRACVAAALAFAGLNGVLFLVTGWSIMGALYADYFQTAGSILFLPFHDGFPAYLLLTPYGFLTGLVGSQHQAAVLFVSNAVAVAFLAWFVTDTWRLRGHGQDAMRLALGRALLLPFLLTPYWMLYDAGILLLACALLTPAREERRMLATGAAVYASLWVLPLLSAVSVPLGVLVPAGLWIHSMRTRRSIVAVSARTGTAAHTAHGAAGA